jgi:hypothetical protein
MSNEKDDRQRAKEVASRGRNGDSSIDDDTPIPGVALIRRPSTRIETELVLLRQAYQDQGKTIGNVLESIRKLESCHADVVMKLDLVLEKLAKR